MKIKYGILLFFFLCYIVSQFAQAQACKVLSEDLNGIYKGDCKKGLANGKGEVSGEDVVYTGEFRKGYPDGEGVLKFNDGTVLKAEWKRGELYGYGELTATDGTAKKGYWKGTIHKYIYVGEDKDFLKGYKILDQEMMDNATIDFVKSDEATDKLVIQINENHVRQINHFEIIEITSGVIHQVINNGGRLKADIINIQYPVTMKIRYILPYGTQDTKLHGGQDNMFSPRTLRFTIVEPGLWTLTITHR